MVDRRRLRGRAGRSPRASSRRCRACRGGGRWSRPASCAGSRDRARALRQLRASRSRRRDCCRSAANRASGSTSRGDGDRGVEPLVEPGEAVGAGVDVDMEVGMERAQLGQMRHQPLRGEERQHARASAASARRCRSRAPSPAPSASSAGPISASSRSPSGLRWTAWWRRSNRGWPTKRSSAWMRRVSAGEDKRQRLGGGLDRAQPRDLDERLDRGERRQSAHRRCSSFIVRCTSDAATQQAARISANHECNNCICSILLRTCTISRAGAKRTLPFRHPLLKTFRVGPSGPALFLLSPRARTRLPAVPAFLNRAVGPAVVLSYLRRATGGATADGRRGTASRRGCRSRRCGPEDSGRGIARLPRAADGAARPRRGRRHRDRSASAPPPARAVGPYPEDEGLDIIRLDGLQRANAEIGSGDFVDDPQGRIASPRSASSSPRRRRICACRARPRR